MNSLNSLSFIDFPDLLLNNIFCFLDVKNFVKTSGVCSKFKRLTQNNTFWHSFFIRNFPLYNSSSQSIDWKESFQRSYGKYLQIWKTLPLYPKVELLAQDEQMTQFERKGRFVVFSSASNIITVIDLNLPKSVYSRYSLKKFEAITALCLSKKYIFTGHLDGQIKRIDFLNTKKTRTLKVFPAEIVTLKVINQSLIGFAKGQSIKVIDQNSFKEKISFLRHEVFSTLKSIYLIGRQVFTLHEEQKKSCHIWDLSTGELCQTLENIEDVTSYQDDSHFIAVQKQSLKFWEWDHLNQSWKKLKRNFFQIGGNISRVFCPKVEFSVKKIIIILTKTIIIGGSNQKQFSDEVHVFDLEIGKLSPLMTFKNNLLPLQVSLQIDNLMVLEPHSGKLHQILFL